MTENTVLRFDGICKRFPGVRALDHVSFTLNKGEVLALVGENGAGKSTLVKCLTGALVPDEGTIEVLGNTYTRIDPLEINKLGIAAIYQEFNLVPDLPVCENVFMGKNTIIGAGSIVTRDIPENVIAVGNPCKVMREVSERDKEYFYKNEKVSDCFL
ncbi:MAG: ATP-binding cassette domain-containing protein [Anaerolineaceae bacterium]|nr:ATP-binding cassette domain-containing protein [Anaerolineaceae bacterium]MBQ6492941.1 ATP-binding cassette domain-containing protein [Erysipelotrichaceae bacterium]